jgi:hypothetical protein
MKEFHRYKYSQCASGSAMTTVATWSVAGCTLIRKTYRCAASSTAGMPGGRKGIL